MPQSKSKEPYPLINLSVGFEVNHPGEIGITMNRYGLFILRAVVNSPKVLLVLIGWTNYGQRPPGIRQNYMNPVALCGTRTGHWLTLEFGTYFNDPWGLGSITPPIQRTRWKFDFDIRRQLLFSVIWQPRSRSHSMLLSTTKKEKLLTNALCSYVG